MLRELTREDQSDGSLDLSRTEDSLVVISNKATCLRSNLLESVVNQRVHDGDGSLADTNVRMDLLEDTNDVSAVRLLSLSMSLDSLLRSSLLDNFLSGHLFEIIVICSDSTPNG